MIEMRAAFFLPGTLKLHSPNIKPAYSCHEKKPRDPYGQVERSATSAEPQIYHFPFPRILEIALFPRRLRGTSNIVPFRLPGRIVVRLRHLPPPRLVSLCYRLLVLGINCSKSS